MAKKCTNEGRALMQLDFRHFVMKLERIAELKPLPYQDHVVNYVKAYYIPEAELEHWVKVHPVSIVHVLPRLERRRTIKLTRFSWVGLIEGCIIQIQSK